MSVLAQTTFNTPPIHVIQCSPTLPSLLASPLPAATPTATSTTTTTTPVSATSDCASRSSSQQNLDTDSAKSSCSPAPLLDCSYDSGISVEVNDMQLQKRIQQCKRILLALERDKTSYNDLRNRLSKLVDKRNKNEEEQQAEICNVCCADIKTTNTKSFVTCCTCKRNVCRDIKCATWLPKCAQWECELCHKSKDSLAHTSSWVAEQLSFNQQKYVLPMRARSEIYIPINDCNDSSMNFESVSQNGANEAVITADQKVKIREYVEEVVASILGGSLDNVQVGQLSNKENYLPAIFNCHNATAATTTNAINNNNTIAQSPNGNGNSNIQNEFANVSHTRLRQLIETIIAETLRLPALGGGAPIAATSEIMLDTQNSFTNNNNSKQHALTLTNGDVKRRHRTEHYFEPKIYQDLLATAVLNKLIDHEGNTRTLSESTPDLAARNVDVNLNVESLSNASDSSLEPRSDCSYTDSERLLQARVAADLGRESALSDYVASHMVPLPDLTATATESEDDEIGSVTSSAIGEGGTWEDNWLFKKKRCSTSASRTSSTVGMLVPAPKEIVRAQIGDKTADEISDLSELGSDTDDSSLDLMHGTVVEPLNDRLLNKHLIGGQNTKHVLDELIESASFVSQSAADGKEAVVAETKNELAIKTVNKTEAINKKLTDAKIAKLESEDYMDATQSSPNPGSIAEREHKKWNNAVDMPNNPYAPEALKRRISCGSQERIMDLPTISPSTEQNPIELLKQTDVTQQDDENREKDYLRYSRDYYINDQKQTSCTAKADAAVSSNMDICNSENRIINEVMPNDSTSKRTSCNLSNKNASNDCHWTLSTPVRRSSSLKFINANYATSSSSSMSPKNMLHRNTRSYVTSPSPTTYYKSTNTIHYQQAPSLQTLPQPPPPILPTRCHTSASHYADDIDAAAITYYDDNDDIRSQRSWQSATAVYGSTLPKRRTLSTLSLHSNASAVSFNSSVSKRHVAAATAGMHRQQNGNILSQFEKQLLHKDLKRNSFRAISATTKDFVMNPLFDNEQFYDTHATRTGARQKSKDCDDQVDSGVDSCLNGFSGETDAKVSKNSLIF